MIIYKITNLINNKVYIGQTIRTLQQRFNRHINDAMNNNLNTHFARAIRKYGPENFAIEIIDTATSQDELTQKEQYWIGYYNSINEGYNETDSQFKCGGNTYQSKSEEELKAISKKLSESKTGVLNPNARKIKCKNINTKEEYHFDTLAECQRFFNESNHQFVSRRCLHKVKDLQTNEEKTFNSYADAERYFNVPLTSFRKCAAAKRGEKNFITKNRYQILVLD